MAEIKKNLMLDGMLGLVTGDALGVPVQFMTREEIAIRPQGPVTGMEGFGTYDMPPGTWSDDSSMALAALESIRRLGRVDPDDIMQNFLKWELNGEFTPYGYAFDQGNTCSHAIYNYQYDCDWHICGRTGEHANGNGALMRILPVCIYFAERGKNICTSDDEAIESIHSVTLLTHNHLRAMIASGLYFFMVKALIRARETAVTSVADTAEPGKAALTENTGNLHAREAVAATPAFSEQNTSAEHDRSLLHLLQQGIDEGFAYYRHDFRNLTEMSRYSRLYDLHKLREIPASEIRGSGYVVDSLEAAVWSLITTDTLPEALLKAVNLGDDTDTVAAIAGGLAGLYYGANAIPPEWLEALKRREWILEMCST